MIECTTITPEMSTTVAELSHVVYLPIPAESTHIELKQRLALMRETYKQLTSSPGALDCLTLAMAVATSLTTPESNVDVPLWLLLVGAPSTGKTTTVNLLQGSPKHPNRSFYPLSTMSPGSLLSGFVDNQGTKAPSLLKNLNGKCLVMSELAALFSGRSDKVQELLGAWCAMFDGTFNKATGTVGTLQSESRFSMLGCITTSALQQHHTYMNKIGGRFLVWRFPALTPEEVVSGFDLAIESQARQQEAKRTLADLVGQQIAQAEAVSNPVDLGPQAKRLIVAMAELIARGRGSVQDNSLEVEAPFRAYHQLMNLAKSVARVSGHTRIESSTLELVRRVTLGSLPSHRAKILGCLTQQLDGVQVCDVESATGLKSTQTQAQLNALCSLGVLMKTNGPKKIGKTPDLYKAVPEVAELLQPIAEK